MEPWAKLRSRWMIQVYLVWAYFPVGAFAKQLLPDGTPKPEFVGNVENVTIPMGRDATFACNVKNLGKFRIGWVKSDTKAIQSIHDQVITHNPRVQVTGDFISMFNLHIHRVQQEDRGQYMCQINTDPMLQQTAYLDVNIPPDIAIERTTKDFETSQGSTVSLECHADGYPEPTISWLREDKKYLRVMEQNGEIKTHERYEGNKLTIPNVTPDDMGGYLCIANNKVPPAMSKRVFMYVQFPPQVAAREVIIGGIEGRPSQMRCDVTAYPKPIIYWIHEGNMVLSTGLHEVLENVTSKSETTAILIIRVTNEDTIGKYQCVVKNPFGEAEANVRVYLVSSTESPSSTVHNGQEEETTKRMKKRRKQKTERQKIEEQTPQEEREEFGFGAMSFENVHGPGYTTFEQNVERTESRTNLLIPCSEMLVLLLSIVIISFYC